MLWKWNINIMDHEINKIFYVLLSLCFDQSVKMKSVFEKYLSNTPKYANQIQIQIQIFHLVGFQIQIQIQIQIFAYLNTNTNTNTYLTPALRVCNTRLCIIPTNSPAAITLRLCNSLSGDSANLLGMVLGKGMWLTRLPLDGHSNV